MVLGIIGAIAGATAIPMGAVALPNAATATSTSTVGVSQGSMGKQQASQGSQDGADPNDLRLAKFTLKTHCDQESSLRGQVIRRQVVLRKGKLYLDSPTNPKYDDGHPFSGFFLQYPRPGKPRGLVSTISKDPPELNWIFVDEETLELRYGGKSASIKHLVGPWDWTEDQKGITLEDWEGFAAIQDGEGGWVLCYDLENNHLKRVRGERRVLEVELDRTLIKK